MPAYNAEASIGAAISSVLRQTRADFELIIVDDGSTDDTVSHVKRFLRDARIRLISQPNLGPPAARNTAVSHARGKYVCLLDSDDLWLPRYLEAMATTLDADPGAAVAYTDAWILDDATRKIARVKTMSPWHPAVVPKQPQEFLRALLERGNFIFVGTTIRRWVLDKVGTFRVGLHAAEDYEMWLRIASRGYTFARCPLTLAIYRRKPGQISADSRTMLRSVENVYRIAAEEYDLSEDLRELARQRAQEQEALIVKLGAVRPRRIPRRLRRPYDALSRMRHFYIRPPSEIRETFPDLRAI